jgi:uncharacterized membrane protein YvbJ
MFCSKCGHKNEVSASQFCAQCGAALNSGNTYVHTSPQSDQPKPVLANLAIIFASISLFFLPLVFGLAAFVLGIIAVVQKQKNAVLGLVLACVFPVIGFIIGYAVALSSFGY